MSRKKWSYSAGERPYTVVVYERTPGGTLQVRAWDPPLNGGKGGWRRNDQGQLFCRSATIRIAGC